MYNKKGKTSPEILPPRDQICSYLSVYNFLEFHIVKNSTLKGKSENSNEIIDSDSGKIPVARILIQFPRFFLPDVQTLYNFLYLILVSVNNYAGNTPLF